MSARCNDLHLSAVATHCAYAERFAGPSAFSSLPAESSSMLGANNSNHGYDFRCLSSRCFLFGCTCGWLLMMG